MTRGYLFPASTSSSPRSRTASPSRSPFRWSSTRSPPVGLDTRRATALLYGLQLASSNAARLNLTPYAPDVVRTAESTPDGLDLAEPGAILDLDQLALRNQDDEYDDDGEEYEDD